MKIEDGELKECTDKDVESVVIPDDVTKIGEDAFEECESLSSVEFSGTVAQWEAVKKWIFWHDGVPATSVKCSDGESKL